MALTASAVFWGTGAVAHDFRGEPPAGSVRSAPLDGGPATTLGPAENPAGLAADATGVVWSSAPVVKSGGFFGAGASETTGGVSQIDLAGGSAVTLDSNRDRMPSDGAIAIDAAAAYWITSRRAILRTAR